MIIQLSHKVLEFTARAGNGMSPKMASIYYLSKNIAKIKIQFKKIIPARDVGKTSFHKLTAFRDDDKRDDNNIKYAKEGLE